jgi:hypothetical protein
MHSAIRLGSVNTFSKRPNFSFIEEVGLTGKHGHYLRS